MTPTRITTIRIDDELLDGLQALKDRDGIPISVQVRKAIELWLQEKGVKTKTDRKRAVTRKRS